MRKQMSYRIVLASLAALACVIAGAANARTFAAPTITGFGPDRGIVGSKVTIYGHNLAGAQVQFNGVRAQTAVVDATGTHITTIVPPEVATGPGPITVTTPGGMVMSSTRFLVNPPSRPTSVPGPRISTFAPMSGKPGTRVTIRGANLGGAMWVKFGGVKATFTVPAASRIVAIVPKGAHSGKITLRTSGGVTASGRSFAFKAHSGV